MPKHDDHYIRSYCEKDEVICLNCGSIANRDYRHRSAEECPGPPKRLKPGVKPERPKSRTRIDSTKSSAKDIIGGIPGRDAL